MADHAPVLTYHSISGAGGPTSIPPKTFAMQMQALTDAGYRTWQLQEFIDWFEGDDASDDGGRRVLITFDDAFSDFAEVAVPILEQHGFSAVVFVPTAQIGLGELWTGASQPPRPLMDWDTIRDLGSRRMEFGGHSCTHADLTSISADAREIEIAQCGKDLAVQTGKEIVSFAAPYGRVDSKVIETVAQHYSVAFGTRLARARKGRDRFDVPRIEMHYFRDEPRWRNFLEGHSGYFRLRQGLRAVRSIAGGALG